jgi:hypothetical protein
LNKSALKGTCRVLELLYQGGKDNTALSGLCASAAYRKMEILMRALCWHGKGDVRVDTVPDPKIERPRDVIIKITACAICGSDLRRDDVKPLAANRLAKGRQPQTFKTLLPFPGCRDDGVEGDVRRGIEVEHQPVRHLRRAGMVIPWMELHRGDLAGRDP